MSYISQTAGRSRPLHNLPRTADIAGHRHRAGSRKDTSGADRGRTGTGHDADRATDTADRGADRGADTADIYGQRDGHRGHIRTEPRDGHGATGRLGQRVRFGQNGLGQARIRASGRQKANGHREHGTDTCGYQKTGSDHRS